MAYTDYYDDLKNDKLLGIYGFYGPESFIIKSMLDLTKEKLILKGLEELDYVYVNGKNLDFSDAKSYVEILPFASEKRVVVIENPDFFDTEKWGLKKIEKFLDLHKDGNVLTILLFDKIDKKKSSYKVLSKVGKLVEFQRLDRNSLIRWIQKSKFIKKDISEPASIYIADESGYLEKNSFIDLFYIKNLLELVSNSTKNSTISLEDVKTYLESSVKANVFKWRDSVIRGNIAESSKLLNALLEKEEHPIKLFSIFQSFVRDIYKFSLLKDSGLSKYEISKLLKKQDFIIKDYENIYNEFSKEKIGKLIDLCVETDDFLKIGSVDGVLALNRLVFKIKELILLQK